ncbi:CPBP family intramembrane glutamic endopeptidase [Fervidibacillus halotolerans]|uniref:CPBP family intramembrane metalloprotease n=1 Tax=Fervidibacillus halotolerans TaxID=2980027 RepID=A0A9E8M054_9BACI|nr:CPBP family intramembrane glutamic endopeptidase [Fervidibacillus halotolerans]WAA12577.1 CPBP family intramembrane metalloprotease [Fervidibacillus halotolerans]
MKKNYQLILVTYIAMQLLLGIGLQMTRLILKQIGYSGDQLVSLSFSIWIVLSFSVTLFITLYQLRNEWGLKNRKAAPLLPSLLWTVSGVFLALFAQSLAIQIELLLGIQTGSENTEYIVNIIKMAPVVMITSSLIGPILEEIVFRKIIFGSLYKRFNFFTSALVSSILFALAHLEIEHIILYSAMGFVFSFLYVKTQRIIVPIATHMLMNTFVIIVQLTY